ncbi:TIGR02281 family clan AA aspartic protease [uncultured Sphingomonas sp.]|uniref:retropepsin-like aspartic protease family protein n=1 Tax=uncultured Sphingomonas sp. TaxID=158754 RepID=UPI0025E1085A|nr:TIGR02281 family clan AA aspartic protease [uncultured Sphingomonas sp.]
MADDSAPSALYLLLCLLLVASSLFGMRMPIGKAAKIVLAWVAIFGVGFALFAFRSDFSSLGNKLRDEAFGASTVEGAGGELRIPMQEDGHFWVDARVNSAPVRFLVDSGASVTTISRKVADAARIETGMRVAEVETANGTVRMRPARAERLQMGPIRLSDVAVLVAEQEGLNVLGMNTLSSLEGWGVQGRTLVLQP